MILACLWAKKGKSSRRIKQHSAARAVLRLLLARRRPPEPGGNRRRVVFPLNHELRAALIETKHLVRKVQPVHDEVEPVAQPQTSLRVHLQVRIEVNVAERSLQASRRRSRTVGAV